MQQGDPKPVTPASAGPASLIALVEALLFVGRQPLLPKTVAESFPGVSALEVARAVGVLHDRYEAQKRPYRVVADGRGYRLSLDDTTRQELLSRATVDRGVQLSRSAIETLAIVAYRQPTTREEIERLLGIDAQPVLRQLQRLDLVSSDGSQPATFVTTQRFLDLFGLESVSDMPISEDLQVK